MLLCGVLQAAVLTELPWLQMRYHQHPALASVDPFCWFPTATDALGIAAARCQGTVAAAHLGHQRQADARAAREEHARAGRARSAAGGGWQR